MLTRCPTCGTTFRLRAEQLGQADGRVRCGKCSCAFFAVEHRIDADSPAQPSIPAAPAETDNLPPLPTAAAHFSALGHRKRFVAQPDPASTESAQASEVDATVSGPEDLNLPPAVPLGALGETAVGPREPLEQEPAAESPPEPTAESPPEQDEQSIAPPDGGESAQAREPMQPAAEELVAEEAISEQAPEQALPATEAATADSADEAESAAAVPTSDYLAGTAPVRKWPLAAIAGLLGAALIIQLGYAYRSELAKTYPGWRPALERACNLFGCTVELPRDAERVSIESSDLNPESDKKRLQLAATLKNRADYPQSYPHLELTLTDVTDQPLVRRVLAPGEYLTKNAAPSFGPNAEIAIKLTLEIDEVNASGYRVYLFYP